MVFIQRTQLNAYLIPKSVLSDTRSGYSIERKTSKYTQLNLLMFVRHKKTSVTNMTDVCTCLSRTDSKLE
jgi:hypothetical protein